ncbi:MAG: tRNA (N(6)-L-threonylcarbamoyladenosine(37)-C(2))-methylthiotransferase MtaB [Tannerellaceae bacterium]|jgi:threonylcarbamoyladenosine tRNA methylthiotransferase MtaB|nr:tRNA (N(6)-L-threonylcarbamoyladenosine(37)-C(2))-methylthiotransferase MtaB [Tannerellaceae bacterium]
MTDQRIFEDKRAAFYTLGCKLNFAETSAIAKLFDERGIRRAKGSEKADLCVINTCSVTEAADKKCRQAIRRIAGQHPEAFVVVTGCYAQLKPEEAAAIEGVDLVLGTANKLDILRYVDGGAANRIDVSPTAVLSAFTPSCSADDRTRHFLKVQDGCDYHCSYCTIPQARGRSRNGDIASLVSQAEEAARRGGKEIVLTGVNIGDFGKSTSESFTDLLRALDAVEGIERYRISSVEPNLLSNELIDFVAGSRRFAPHFHIPLQSGSDAVLRLMRRRYTTDLFRRRIEKIRETLPEAFIGVDVIVGMRGETAALFDESFAFIEELDISQLHVFTYSERDNTAALDITPIVSPAEKRLRSKRLIELSVHKLAAFCNRFVGTQAQVLFEHARRGKMMHGFTANYVKVETPYDLSLANRITPVDLLPCNAAGSALTCRIR